MIVNVIGVPWQVTPPFVKFGVTVIVPNIAAVVVFVAVKDGKLPVPLAPKPIAVLLFVQLNVTPAGVPPNIVLGTSAPVQYV